MVAIKLEIVDRPIIPAQYRISDAEAAEIGKRCHPEYSMPRHGWENQDETVEAIRDEQARLMEDYGSCRPQLVELVLDFE